MTINEAATQLGIGRDAIEQLADNEHILFGFGKLYAFTWEKSRFWFYVDYQQDPLRIHTYSPTDQQLIRLQMEAIAQEFHQD